MSQGPHLMTDGKCWPTLPLLNVPAVSSQLPLHWHWHWHNLTASSEKPIAVGSCVRDLVVHTLLAHLCHWACAMQHIFRLLLCLCYTVLSSSSSHFYMSIAESLIF